MGAGHHVMALSTGATGVMLLGAVGSQMVPTLALEAPEWFFLAFLSVYLFVTDKQTVSECIIGRLRGEEGEDSMPAYLQRNTMGHWLDPPGPCDVALLQPIDFLNLS